MRPLPPSWYINHPRASVILVPSLLAPSNTRYQPASKSYVKQQSPRAFTRCSASAGPAIFAGGAPSNLGLKAILIQAFTPKIGEIGNTQRGDQ